MPIPHMCLIRTTDLYDEYPPPVDNFPQPAADPGMLALAAAELRRTSGQRPTVLRRRTGTFDEGYGGL